MEGPFFEAIEFFKDFEVQETEIELNQWLDSDNKILAEGAQGSLLDIDFGSYPFVTSSNTTVAGACTGLGVAPQKIGSVYGIFKAYCTRVGSGPFPTELTDSVGEKLSEAGNEFGATTGRPRRCGWLDLPALKYTTMLNGVNELFMMKVDVLSAFDEIKVCTHYILENGERVDCYPPDSENERFNPHFETLPGWKKNLEDVKDEKEFPSELNTYISYIENQINIPITLVSVGPGRMQTIRRSI